MARIEVSQKEGSKEAAFVQKLLSTYFQFRDCLPRTGYVQENKTTQQIRDELLPMYPVSIDDIVGYMVQAGYSTTTEADGSVAWAIWRQA